MVFVTKTWAQQLLVADEFQADLIPVKSALHDLAIGHSEGDRRGAAAQGSGTQQSLAHQAHLGSSFHNDPEVLHLAGTAYPGVQLAMFANLVYRMQLEDGRVDQHLCNLAGQAVLRG